jgi:hypothetical protein
LEENNKCVLELVKKTYIWGQEQSWVWAEQGHSLPQFFYKKFKVRKSIYIV